MILHSLASAMLVGQTGFEIDLAGTMCKCSFWTSEKSVLGWDPNLLPPFSDKMEIQKV